MAAVDILKSIRENWKAYKFVEDVPDHLFCVLCRLPVQSPRLTACCGYNMCESCALDPALVNKQTPETRTACPKCGEQGFTAYPNKMSERELLNLAVYCTSGCRWSGKLADLSDHIHNNKDGCPLYETECPNGCGTKAKRRDIFEHTRNHCPNSIVSCPDCFLRDKRCVVEGEHANHCAKATVECPNKCGAAISTDSVKEHRNACPLEELECEFKSFGCEVIVARCNVKQHNQESLQTHLSLARSQLAEATRELEASKRELAVLEGRAKDRNCLMASKMLEVLKMVVLVGEMERAPNKQERSKLNVQFDLLLQSVHSFRKEQILPLTLRLDGFSKLFCSKSRWISTPFFAYPNGHRLCMHVYPAGIKGTEGYMSIFLHLMDGLVWPQPGTIVIELCNQLSKKKEHSNCGIFVDSSNINWREKEHNSVVQRSDGTVSALGCGVGKVVAHSVLTKLGPLCQFLKDDSLFFKVSYSHQRSDRGNLLSGHSIATDFAKLSAHN